MKYFFALMAGALFLTGVAQAQVEPSAQENLELHQRWDNPQWLHDRAKAAASGTACQERWDILWSWAKKGNLQARNGLLATLSPWTPFTRTPLAPDDDSQTVWVRVLLAIHQLGYREDAAIDLEKTVLDHIGTWKHKGVARFEACYRKNPSPDCTAIAVEEGMVPAFDVFAKQVDARIAAGAKPVCRGER